MAPRLGKIDLLSAALPTDSGAAFVLPSAARGDAFLRFADAEIELREGQRDVVVRFSGAADASDAYQKGHSLAQQGLDLLSMLGRLDGVIAEAEDQHVLWWTEQIGLVVRFVSTATLRFGVGPVTIEVRDTQGNVVPPKPIVPCHHIGFRFFRLAQVSDDLYDAYRNMYLAFEVLLSSRFPISKGEREGHWLNRALGGASGDMNLTDLVPSSPRNTVEAVLDVVYYDGRLPLFHAKEGRAFYAPQDSPANREVISRALRTLTHIVLRMSETWFQARRMRGGVSLGWVYEQAAEQLRGLTIVASGDSSPFDASESDLAHARFREGLRMSTHLAPELMKGKAPAVLGTTQGTDITRLPVLRRFDLVTSSSPYVAYTLETDCVLTGVERLEVVSHLRAMNLNEPKSLFKT